MEKTQKDLVEGRKEGRKEVEGQRERKREEGGREEATIYIVNGG